MGEKLKSCSLLRVMGTGTEVNLSPMILGRGFCLDEMN